MVSLAVSLKAMKPLSLWVLTVSHNLHLNLGVLEFPGGRPLFLMEFMIVLFICRAV